MDKESAVQSWVRIQILKEFEDAFVFKCPSGPYSSRRGIPDLIMSIYGLFVAIEVKTEKGVASKLQDHEIKKIIKSGGQAYIIYGKDEVELNRILLGIKDELRIRGITSI